MKIKNIDLFVGILVISLFTLVFFSDCINTIQYQGLGYDEAYNATVAANVMRYGEYRISYPANIIFYNLITTGETVILPTALLFKLWGINSVTASIVALIYGIGCIIAVWGLFATCLKNFSNKAYSLAAIGCLLLISSDSFFIYISTHLIGETAALFFTLLAIIFLKKFFDNKRPILIILSGAMFAFSFLTKSSMIFIVVSIIGLMIIETTIMKSLTRKNLLYFVGGFSIGFIVLELYKLIQLGGIYEYSNWWYSEWDNMINQSGGVDITYSVLDKLNYLTEIFGGCAPISCLLITILPIIIYVIMIIQKKFKQNDYHNYGLKVITHSGICGSSLIIYFVLLGGSGLVYARRHAVNAFLIRLCAIFICLLLAIHLFKKFQVKKYYACFGIATISVTILFSTISINTIVTNCNTYIDKTHENTYMAKIMYEFLDEVKQLPEDAMLYCAGWWQEPNISLYLDRTMINVYDAIYSANTQPNNGYFIVGNLIHNVTIGDIENLLNVKLIRIDTTNVNYEMLWTAYDRCDFESFAIYKMVPCIN